MSWLLVLLCVLLFIYLLSLVRIGARVQYVSNTLQVDLSVMKWSITILPGKERKKKLKKNSGKKVDSKKDKKPKKSRSIQEILTLIKLFVPILTRAVKGVLGTILIDPMKIHWVVGSSDPATTAITYGLAQSTLTATIPLIDRVFTIQNQDISLGLDFDTERSEFDVLVGVSMTIGQGVALGFGLIWEVIIAYIANNKSIKKKEMV